MIRNALEPWHLVIVILVIVVVFGSKKLPDAARSLGKSARILKSEMQAMKDEGRQSATTAHASAPQPSAQHVVQVSPGDVNGARPVSEPTEATEANQR
ncbi:Sec-independent protein translocase subunit TatA [Streptomyces sp. RGM 3693]|uniref:Sec-independent protein translocase subunit TatA n=1 Tax=Streptomyces sp. RGM 3693 TaxID=3413284 RepID=UPI003D2B07C8